MLLHDRGIATVSPLEIGVAVVITLLLMLAVIGFLTSGRR
jgi:hypothetical protein